MSTRQNTIILLLFSSVVFAQEVRVSTVSALAPQGIPLDSYTGIGFSNIQHSLASEIASGNPASLSGATSLAFGLNFELSTPTNIEPFDDFEMNKHNQWLVCQRLLFPQQPFLILGW